MQKNKQKILVFGIFIFTILVVPSPISAQKEPNLARVFAEAKSRQGKRPVIIIPGILGSELVNKETGEVVWFNLSRAKDDDARLPVGTNLRETKDKLVPRDVIRKVEVAGFLPEIQVYQQLINTLQNYGGYTEGSWDNPLEKIEDTFFVFPYDWRRDNVETARLLVMQIENLKKKLKRSDLKFNILAHSMGGLIARYAAMYGDQDLPDDTGKLPQLNWAGEKHFNKVFLFGTPNEGSANALRSLLKGFEPIKGGKYLPFIRSFTPSDLATMPALFQLMPHGESARFFDEDLNPLEIDLYDVRYWKKYNWSIYGDENFAKDLSDAERGRFDEYFSLILKRSKKFHQALDAKTSKRASVGFFLIGSDCQDTLDAFVIYHDPKKNKWVTLTDTDSFKNSKDEKVLSDKLKPLMLMPGDGSVTRRSLLAETFDKDRRQSILFDSALPLTSALFICEEHGKLTANATVQNNFLTALIGEATR